MHARDVIPVQPLFAMLGVNIPPAETARFPILLSLIPERLDSKFPLKRKNEPTVAVLRVRWLVVFDHGSFSGERTGCFILLSSISQNFNESFSAGKQQVYAAGREPFD